MNSSPTRPTQRPSESTQWRAWLVWSTGLLAYTVAVMNRTTFGVAGLEAAERFDASPAVLSTFVVLQLTVYAAAQIPAGVLLDRFGSKAMILTGGILMVIGQLTLALTEILPAAVAATAWRAMLSSTADNQAGSARPSSSRRRRSAMAVSWAATSRAWPGSSA